MDDIRLINILNSPSQNVKQPGITDSNSTNLPPIINRFAPGSILAGFIINRDAAGNPVLRTESGDISFSSKLFLKIGTEVEIKVENRFGNTTARLVSVNGQPPPQAQPVSITANNFPGAPVTSSAATPSAQNVAPQAAQTPAPTQASPATTVSNPTLTGSVVSAPSNAPLPANTPLSVRLVLIVPPVTGNTPASPAPAQPATSAAALPAVPTVTQATGAPPQATPPSVTNAADAAHYAAYRASSAITPASATPAPLPPAASGAATLIQPQTVQGTVTGSTPAGETLVQTQQGAVIRIATASPLPVGSNVTLQVAQAASAPVSTTPLPTIATLTQKWPSLSEVIKLLLQEIGPQQLGAAGLSWLSPLAQGTGQPPPTPQAISTGLILFLLALKGSDFRGWIGQDNIRLLESKGHANLLRTAEGEFAALARQWNEAQPGQWQSLFFPLAVHGDIQQLRFYTKRDRRKDNQDQEEEDTRFVIETELSQLGELQLDGFTRKTASHLEFDLYIRTRLQLSEEIQKDIFAIYNNFGELTGFKGQLAFQTVDEFPVHPLEEIIHEGDVGDVIV
ncbi:MAG: hypothetical protein AB7L92_05705 [Alphaproteobacteria bacterium]